MTLEQFVAAHTGQVTDYDGKFGGQCVDLIDFYAFQVLSIPIVWVTGAIDWYAKDAAFLDWTPNRWGDRNSKPPRGSIIVWRANARAGTGVYGHIAIGWDPGDGLTFTSFDENYPTGSRPHLQRHSFDGVIGWGSRIVTPPPKPPPPLDPCASVKDQLGAALARVHAWESWYGQKPA